MIPGKRALLILLTGACLLLCALLPGIFSRFQDEQALGTPGYEAARPILLDVQEDIPPLDLLSLIRQPERLVEISEDLAALTREEAEQCALSALDPYISAGLIPPFTPRFYEVRPLLIQAETAPEMTGIVWSILIEGGGSGENFFANLQLDDATGKLLLLHISHEMLDPNAQQDNLELFADIFFRELGLADYQSFATTGLDGQYVGDHAIAIRYCFPDARSGDVNVDLILYQDGFYTQLP